MEKNPYQEIPPLYLFAMSSFFYFVSYLYCVACSSQELLKTGANRRQIHRFAKTMPRLRYKRLGDWFLRALHDACLLGADIPVW